MGEKGHKTERVVKTMNTLEKNLFDLVFQYALHSSSSFPGSQKITFVVLFLASSKAAEVLAMRGKRFQQALSAPAVLPTI